MVAADAAGTKLGPTISTIRPGLRRTYTSLLAVPLPCHNGVKQGGTRRYGLESLMPPDQVFCVSVLLRSTLRAAF
jgi:hypothetical protein